MTEEPTIDGRSRADLLESLRETAVNYTETWDPHSSDSGTTLLQIFSRFQHDVTERLNNVPEKHRVAFLDALDFSRRPPQAARAPLSFETTDDIASNVVVPGGTQATAETEDGETVIFEIPSDEGFEATPADLTSVYGVDPANDRIFDHGERLERGEGATLFAGPDVQTHAFYLGHADLLNLEAESTITVRLLTNAAEPVLEDSLVWEYYGEGEEGIGWHRLPQQTTDTIEVYADAGIENLREAVKERIQEYDADDVTEWGNNPFELSFELPGPTEDFEVNGIESRWIRARTVDPHPAYVDIEIESISLNVERDTEEGGIVPEEALHNDVPLSLDDEEVVYPFGRSPQAPTTMYLASEEAFTKTGAVIEVRFESPEEPREPLSTDDGDGDGSENGNGDGEENTDEEQDWIPETMGTPGAEEPPEISWEYWNGEGWARLRLSEDTTRDLQESGIVRFTVPSNLTETSVSGHDGHWIRARFLSGSYGQYRYEINSDGTRGDPIDRPEPPRFGTIRLSYSQKGESFETVLTNNNASFREIEADGPQLPFVPFAEPPEETQTVYLGFDDVLHDGPINLHLLTEDRTYPRAFEPRIRWEYCVAPERMAWNRLDVHDGTEGLTEQGIVSLTFPEATTAFELFGERRHWIRFRVTGDEFHIGAGQQKVAGNRPVTDLASGGPAEIPATPPTVKAVYPNTQWSYNVETIEDEVLGSSDGSHGQTFACEEAPVMDVEVWVDELGALSGAERQTLSAERPADVERVESGTDVEAFWVRWTGVDDFLDSEPSDRHYRIDRIAGRVTFGDGQRGAIPPRGEENVRATYETGGGQKGNIGAGAIADLQDSIPLIDEVTNHRPSDGGADVESMETVMSRAPKRIKNRGRAVAPNDFEEVAKAASRELATVKCEPEMDANGNRRPGWVTLLIVPRERRARPAPTIELRQRVADAVAERAPATLAGGDRERITVRGPNYVPISIETTVRARAVESISTLKGTIESTLTDYLHPLTGGHSGEGWAFGEAPRLSQILSLLDDVDGVSAVSDVLMSVSTQDETVKIRDETIVPDLDRDAMICSGSHEVTVTRSSPEEGAN